MSETESEIASPSINRSVLFQTEAFEVVSIEWRRSSLSAMHDHGWSQCHILIESGEFENTLNLGSKIETRRLVAGDIVSTPLGARHEMRCLSDSGKTLHVYTPRIQKWSAAGVFRAEDLEQLNAELTLKVPTSVEEIRRLLNSVRDQSLTTNSPYFMNQLFSGISPQMLMAEELVAQTKTTLATFEASPVFSMIEVETIKSLGEVLGWAPSEVDGIAVPGGSAANFMALHCARQKLFPDFKTKGMQGRVLHVYVSAEAHYSFKKACVALGLGTDSLLAVPVDKSGRMNVELLEKMIVQSREVGAIPLMVAATAGTTVLGAFDPADEISRVCKAQGIWLHVDAAWGGPALFSAQLRHLVRGIEDADSVTFDAHKLFGAALTSSFFLTQHPRILLESNDVSGGDYLFHAADPAADRGKKSWQCGRRAEATSFWAIWKSLGSVGLGSLVDKLIQTRNELLAWLPKQPRLELVSSPEYLNICIRIKPPREVLNSATWSRVVRERLKEQNQALVNFSENGEGSFLRLILANPDLKIEHVIQILEWALAVE